MTTLSPEIERLAKLVGAQTGKTPEEVIREAVETQARIAGVEIPEPARARKDVDLARVREITRRVASRPLLDKRPPEQILDEAWGHRG
jgi:antitoxin VapB